MATPSGLSSRSAHQSPKSDRAGPSCSGWRSGDAPNLGRRPVPPPMFPYLRIRHRTPYTIMMIRRRKRPPNNQPHPCARNSASPEDSPKFVLWMPATGPRQVEHCVTFSEVAATHRAQDGIYHSLCCIRFAPAASMTAPPWPHCTHCRQRHQQWEEDWKKSQQLLHRRRRRQHVRRSDS
jgi:hypothetical protein